MRARDPEGTLKEKCGSCYVSDGWDSCDNLPLINSAFITANDGGMYWRSVDTSGKTKSAEYCAMLMIMDIYEYGPANVTCDNTLRIGKYVRIILYHACWQMAVLCIIRIVLYFVLYLYYVLSYPGRIPSAPELHLQLYSLSP